MTKKSIVKNYIYNLSYQILAMIIPIITTPYLSRVLGAENIGIYSYTLSITTYFILLGTLGIASYGQREVAYLQDDKYKRTKVFFEILLMRFITLTISLILFYFTFIRHGEYGIYYKILILEIIASSLDISWFFQGLEEFKKTVLKNFVVKIISVICIFIFIKNPSDLNKYFLIYVTSNLLGNISLWVNLKSYITKIKFKDLQIFRHLKPCFSLFVPQIAIQIYTVLDKTMIGTISTDISEVGFYEQAQKIIKLCMTIATSIGTVMAPRIANIYIKGNKKQLKEYMEKSFSFILMLTLPMMFGLISISDNFVPIFFGEGYDKVAILIKIISPIIVIIGLSNVIGTQYLLPTKQQKKYTISVVTGALVNVILNSILIYYWKSIGASIATLIAELIVTSLQFYLVRSEIKPKVILKKSYKYFIISLLSFMICLILNCYITNNFISTVVQILVFILIYFLALILLKDKMLLTWIEKIGKK